MSLFISNFIYCNSTSKRQNSIIYGPDGFNFVKVTLLWVCGSKIYSDTTCIVGCTMMRFHTLLVGCWGKDALLMVLVEVIECHNFENIKI